MMPARSTHARHTLVRTVRWISLLSAGITLSALSAHVLELPNKLRLDGPLWLAIQNELYRGWGLYIGPFEVVAVVSTWILVYLSRRRPASSGLVLVASLLLSAALASFFVLNAPVNAAFASWTPETLPSDWPAYRLRWEAGHAIGFVLVLVASIALLRAFFREAVDRTAESRRSRQGDRARRA